MNAEEAKVLTVKSKKRKEKQELNKVKKMIKQCAKDGRSHFSVYDQYLYDSTIKWLQENGYKIDDEEHFYKYISWD